jgi:hypothetical protein
MTRILAQYVSLETAALGLFELILSFAIIEAVLIVVPGALPAWTPISPTSPSSLPSSPPPSPPPSASTAPRSASSGAASW